MGVTRGGLHEVGVMQGGCHARYESPSEMFHSLIFVLCGLFTSLMKFCIVSGYSAKSA